MLDLDCSTGKEERLSQLCFVNDYIWLVKERHVCYFFCQPTSKHSCHGIDCISWKDVYSCTSQLDTE